MTAASRHPWLDPALRAQSRVAAAVMAGFCLAMLAGVPFGAGAQLGVLLVGIVITGFPHGAFDHLVARPVLERHLGHQWWAPFLIGYMGLAGLVWLAWALAPAATLAGFLAASVLHFGWGDMEDGLVPESVPRVVALLVYGSMPLLLPMALHPAMAAPVLAALAEVPVTSTEDVLRGTAWLLPAWTAAFVWILLTARREWCGVAERLATAAGFALLPPLLAFGLYFSLGHAVRHLLRLGAWRDALDPRLAARWLAGTMLPAGLVCAVGLGLLAWLGRDTTEDVLVPCFRIIAALTLPHMVVTAWLDSGAHPISTEQAAQP